MDWLEPEHEGHSVVAVAEGILEATLIATPAGWRPAGSLRPGMEVLTFDHGPRWLVSAHSCRIGDAPAGLWPLLVPAWALDNRAEMLLLPEQRVLIEADMAEALHGDPFALIPAQALEGWRGIARARPSGDDRAVVLGFDQPEILYASRGVLLSCAGAMMPEALPDGPSYTSYSLAQAQHLLACMMAEEAGAALRLAAQPPVDLTP